jgi:hypothetical protein
LFDADLFFFQIVNLTMRDELPDGEDQVISDTYIEALTLMLESDADVRGTIASLAREVEKQAIDVGTRFSLGPHAMKTLERKDITDLVSFYRSAYPDAQVTDHSTTTDNYQNMNFIVNKAKSHKHLILDGCRITPSGSALWAPNAILQADFDGAQYVGQAHSVLTHKQPGVNKEETLIDVRWFKRLENIDTTHWDDLYRFPHLLVDTQADVESF